MSVVQLVSRTNPCMLLQRENSFSLWFTPQDLHKSFSLPEFQSLEPSLRITNCREMETNSHEIFQGSDICISHWKHFGHIFLLWFTKDILPHCYTKESPVCQALLLSSKLQVMHFTPALPLITFAAFLHSWYRVKCVKQETEELKVGLWLKDKATRLHFLVCRKL